jgi:predicted transcriptional regulator
MKSAGISQLPVYSNGTVVGILDEGDLLEPLVRGTLKPAEPIIHLVKGSVVFVKLEDDLSSLNEQLMKGYIALVEEDKKLEIITKIDLLQFLGAMAELSN